MVHFNREIANHLKKDIRQSSVWIGLDDLETEGTFLYTDGVKATHDNTDWWGNKNPDNFKNNEDCASLWCKKHFHVNDDNCDKKNKVLCTSK